MRTNRVKSVMATGKLAIGTYVGLADPQIVEIIGLAGFDAAFIDMEHTGFDLPLVGEMIRAADLASVTSMVRVPDNDAKLILRLLEMGAQGIVVPHIDGLEGAKRAVDAVRYPPLGHRGAASASRAAAFGAVSWEEQVRTSNEEILLSVMIEDQRGVADIEGIAGTDGIDLISIGPTDLAESMGIRDRYDPRLRATLEDIARRIGRVGKARLSVPMGHAYLPLSPRKLVALGVAYSHVAPGPPQILLRAWTNEVEQIRRSLDEAGE